MYRHETQHLHQGTKEAFLYSRRRKPKTWSNSSEVFEASLGQFYLVSYSTIKKNFHCIWVYAGEIQFSWDGCPIWATKSFQIWYQNVINVEIAKHWHWQTTPEILSITWHFARQNLIEISIPKILRSDNYAWNNGVLFRVYNCKYQKIFNYRNIFSEHNYRTSAQKAITAVLWKCSQTPEERNATKTLRICHNNVGSRQAFEICSTIIKLN